MTSPDTIDRAMADLIERLRKVGHIDYALMDEAAAAIEAIVSRADSAEAEVERLRVALTRLVTTYAGFEDGNGDPCPDVAFAREALSGGQQDG